MKKAVILLLIAVVLCTCIAFVGCNPDEGTEKITIVTTVFAEYDWVNAILGEKKNDFEVVYLLDSGVDLHSYSPSVKDIATVTTCDYFIYVGGESDEWAENALKNTINKDMKVLNLMKFVGEKALDEEESEGMQSAPEEEEEEGAKDEHIWLSLKNVPSFITSIADTLSRLAPESAPVFQANKDAYLKKIAALDEKFSQIVQNAAKKSIVVGDRFPFLYLVKEYGIEYYAAFSGCSAETEASFETVVFLANKVDELGLKYVLKTETSDGKIADTVIANTQKKDAGVLEMQSLQTTVQGKTYLELMEINAETLQKALS